MFQITGQDAKAQAKAKVKFNILLLDCLMIDLFKWLTHCFLSNKVLILNCINIIIHEDAIY